MRASIVLSRRPAAEAWLEIRAGYSHEFSGVPRINAIFVGDPTRTGIGIVAENFDRDSWMAGAGVSFSPQKNLTLYRRPQR